MNEMELLRVIYDLAQQNAGHIEVLNREMGAVQQNLEWLNWCVRIVIFGTMLSVGIGLWNVILHRRSNDTK